MVYGDVYLDVAVKDDGQSGLVTPGAREKVALQPPRSNITAESTTSDTSDVVTGPVQVIWVLPSKDERSTSKVICFDATRINAQRNMSDG
jgi:hypothetical protein